MITTDTSTKTLALQALNGDSYAFGLLYKRHFHMVLATTMSIVNNAHDAEDLAQEAFTHALNKLHQLKQPAAFSGWIRTMAHKMAINHCVRKRRNQLWPTKEGIAYDHPDYKVIEPPDVLTTEERKKLLVEAIDKLSASDQLVLRTFYWRGLKIRKMADELSRPIGTIKRQLFVARKRLRQEMTSKPNTY